MLTKSGAKTFFLVGTGLTSVAFVLLTLDTLKQFGPRTHADQITDEVRHGFEIYTDNNCMGCHTLLGEGAYYAPELTQVMQRRSEAWIRAFLADPETFYPGRRRMVKYDFFDPDLDPEAHVNVSAMIAFFTWVGNIDTNGFPPEPDLEPASIVSVSEPNAAAQPHPEPFDTICMGCHKLQGAGGVVGPALDGVGARMSKEQLATWIADPPAVKPGTTMPNLGLSSEQVDALASFLSTLK